MGGNRWPIKDVVAGIEDTDEVLVEFGTMIIPPIPLYPFHYFRQQFSLLEEFILQLMVIGLPNEANDDGQFVCGVNWVQFLN